MKRKNIEIKAVCPNFEKMRQILTAQHADFHGIDQQVDTYFASKTGFLKLRESTLPFERGLIHYKRSSTLKPKISEITIFPLSEDEDLKRILLASLDVLVVVKKKRELFTIDNVKFHLDTVSKLGTFIEIEAQDTHGLIDKASLVRQCNYYMKMLEIRTEDLVAGSYKDMLKKNK